MRVIGIREMKGKLSELIRAARGGETILVTDRGTAVAELRQVGAAATANIDPELQQLVASGLVRPGAPNHPSLYPEVAPLLHRHSAADLLDLERSGR